MGMQRDFWDVIMKVPEALDKEEITQIKDFCKQSSTPQIYEIATQKKILPFVADVLNSLDIDSEYWKVVNTSYIERTNHIINMLKDVFDVFQNKGCISPVVTENFGALLTTKEHMSCFCSGDVDISADYSERTKIAAALEELGFLKKERKSYHTRIEQDEYLAPDCYLDGFYINIVWRPVIREKDYTIDQRLVDEWLRQERNKGINFEQTNIRLLCPESMLLHCIYHLSVGHYYCASPGIRLITEVDRIIRTNVLDWDQIWKTSSSLKITKRVQVALLLSQSILDTPMDEIHMEAKPAKTVEKLVHSFYHSENGVMTIKEPIGLVSRLKVDVMSDEGNYMTSSLKKCIYAANWFMHR